VCEIEWIHILMCILCVFDFVRVCVREGTDISSGVYPMCVRVCACVCERDKVCERGWVCVCACVYARIDLSSGVYPACVCECVRVCVCV